jgi:nicotinamide-nucleotide amidase
MNAEIIAVGSEMLTPERLDTNSLWLTNELNQLGVEVVAKHIVGDLRERLAGEIRRAMDNAGIVIVSGGLGPTEDDVTRDAAALALGRVQVCHEEIVRGIEARFARMKRVMPETNRRQAMVMEGAEVLFNDRGTAPGQWIPFEKGAVALLPGPPYELKAMFTRECLPRLKGLVPPTVIRTLTMRTTGMSEAALDEAISPIYSCYKKITTTVLAHNSDIQIHFRARCASDAEAGAMLEEIRPKIEAALGDFIYSRNTDPLEVVVGRKLLAAHATLSVAESATGGGLADRISSVPGSSAWFLGGMVTYSRRLKTELLGIPADLIDLHGPVSSEVTGAMATAARARTGATWSIAVTGNAGPTTDGDSAGLGDFYVGIAGPAETTVTQRVWPSPDRMRVRAFAAQLALDLLNRKLGR